MHLRYYNISSKKNNLMDINTVIKELGQTLGLESLSLSDNGVCRLVFDEHLTVDIESDEMGEYVRLHGVVAQLAESPSMDIYEALLVANMQVRETSGSYFGIDAQAREVVLFSNVDMSDATSHDFILILEEFVNYFEIWLKKLNNSEVEETMQPRDTAVVESKSEEQSQAFGLRL